MKWFLDRWQPLLLIVTCYGIGLFSYIAGVSMVSQINPGIAALTISEAPAGVTGADIIANLLTISALTISGCFAYICLPSDRIEVRVATYVRICFYEALIDEIVFDNYCSSIREQDITPSCKALRGLLSPRSGLGGWHRLTNADLKTTFGSSEWKVLSRFVDRHIDAKWMVSLSAALIAGMFLGALSLGLRYLGLKQSFFDPFEFSVIATLTLLNVGTAATAINLAFGGTAGERSARERIDSYVKEIKPHIANWQVNRRDENLGDLADMLNKSEQVRVTNPGNTGAKAVRGTRSRQTPK